MEEMEDMLVKEMSLIRRKTLGISANNVGTAFMQNFEDINKVVEDYNKQSEDAFQNDAILYFQSQKENYQKQIEKLQARVEKSKKQKEELDVVINTLNSEVE
mmetsp:Transcript_5041/g.3692  ORF Transcript_5041/g.3692 Transcript_5041/m.3692 type:complete len:102 (+) Transcript_5041:1181-1486(+)